MYFFNSTTRSLTALICIVTASFVSVATSSAEVAKGSAKRLEVLFLGSKNGSHKPLEQFRNIRKALGAKGINFTYTQDLKDLNSPNLEMYDAMLLYGNHDRIEPAQESAILDYSSNGGGCVFIHSACGCFRNSDKFIELLGAQFKSHGAGVFTPKITDRDHQITAELAEYTVWDESYVHQRINPDKRVLMQREEEPWTWVRKNGKGRVFYTASGHDERCWNDSGFQQLVFNGILWAAGDDVAAKLKNLKLPELKHAKSTVNVLQGKNWPDEPQDRGMPNDHLQLPLDAQESLKLAQIPVDMELQLFASEPMVINPIALGWDKLGRLWVAEGHDYPNSFVMNSPGQDQIKILEDTNGDGKADKSTTFAGGLTIATSVLPIDNGCITTDGEDMVYLEDTDGDGKSDKRHVIWTGISLGDTHACVSNIKLGLDGWIYATVGYAGVSPTVNGKKYNLKQGVFRFTRDGSSFEVIQQTSNNTWGLGFTEQGRVVGSTANMNPSWFVSVPHKYYANSSIKQPRTPAADSRDKAYPITRDHLQVDWKDHFTAAAGHTIYTARLFDEQWWNKRALVCAPTMRLVTAANFTQQGSSFKFSNTQHNIYASADAWSAPVAAEVGPDGAIYIADWYNSIIQHNVYGENQKRGKGNAYINEFRDRKHGRIYKISPKNSTVAKNPTLNTQKDALAALDNDNMFWRLQAQEQLKTQGAPVEELKKIALANSAGSIHAIHSLGQLGESLDFIFEATELNDGLIRAALNYSKADFNIAEKLFKKLPQLSANDAQALILYLVTIPQSEELTKLMHSKRASLSKNKKHDPAFGQALELALEHTGVTESLITIDIPRKELSASAKRGKDVYKATCIACHQPSGEGSPGIFPPLDQSEWLSRDPAHAVMVVLKGLSGGIIVNGNKYNGMMPAHANLSDQEITDVLNYSRNAFGLQLGDISQDFVKATRTGYTKAPSPMHEQHFTKVRTAPVLELNDIDLHKKKKVRSNDAQNSDYKELPSKSLSSAAKSGVIGNATVDISFTLKSSETWAQAWAFGASAQGPGKSGTELEYLALIPRADSGKLRLTAKYEGKELFIDWKPLKLGEKYQIRAQVTPNAFHLFVNGNRVGSQVLPNKMQLEELDDFNCWLGRSLYNDPLFDGTIQDFKVYDF